MVNPSAKLKRDWLLPVETHKGQLLRPHYRECSGREDCAKCGFQSVVDDLSEIEKARKSYEAEVARFDGPDLQLCMFCGARGEGRAFLYPIDWVPKLLKPLVPSVPSCIACETLLKDSNLTSIPERCLIIQRDIQYKYRHDIEIGLKKEEDLEEFGFGLRHRLTQLQSSRVKLFSRLRVLNRGGLSRIPSDWRDHLLSRDYGYVVNAE